MVDSDERLAQNKFRITQNQLRKETQLPRYAKIRNQLKKRELIDGRDVSSWENDLCQFNHKTLMYDGYKDYIRAKSVLNAVVGPFYSTYIWRKLKLSTYMRTQKWESHMMKNFKNKFGSPDQVVICVGDWGDSSHRKHHQPVKGKGLRILFRKYGYSVYLVNEAYTSSRCCKCGDDMGVCSKFRKCVNPKPNKNNVILTHGLVKCDKCNTKWNRDVNGASNIWRIANCAINGQARPTYLTMA